LSTEPNRCGRSASRPANGSTISRPDRAAIPARWKKPWLTDAIRRYGDPVQVRQGGPVDDEEDYDTDCWAGIVPVVPHIGAVIPDPRLKPGIPAKPEVGHFPEGAAFDKVLLALARKAGV
jgi:hypothetical protein